MGISQFAVVEERLSTHARARLHICITPPRVGEVKRPDS
jgi:hypothetical protein